jgi:hypothetical protein
MSATIVTAYTLVLLHAAGGHMVYVYPESITTMRAATPGQENKLITGDANCVVNTSDGKFLSVTETCDEVRALVKSAQEGQQ